MSTTATDDPGREADRLHRRLLDRDPLAPDALAIAFLEPLIRWLAEHNPSVHAHLVEHAAEDAILNLIRDPTSYKPGRSTLEAYLRMSAQGDLRNLLATEKRRTAGKKPLAAVELLDPDGKHTGREDDPALRLMIEEERAELERRIPASVREGLTECETRALELMLQGERRTSVYAEACGLAGLPAEQQEREVKRIKGRLTKRIQRAGEGP